MSEHIEIETKELQEAIDELDEERRERKEEEVRSGWVKYIGLSTAFLAVFAAVGALQSGNLVNEAMLHQIQASDTWAEFQASRSKDHLYTVMLNGIADANASNAGVLAELKKPLVKEAKPVKPASVAAPDALTFAAKSPAARAAEYREKVFEEMSKEDERSAEATRLEEDSAAEVRKHHKFEYSVAIIQVAIAVGAVAALTRVKSVWFVSLIAGGIGVVLFVMGFLA